MRDKVSRQETAEIAPRTMSVPEAGQIYLGIGRNSAYEAAHRGDLPVIRIGKLLRVPVAAMERKLAEVVGR